MDDYPKKTNSEKYIDISHAGAQLIPLGIGAGISHIMNSFFPHGFEKRKEDWLQNLAETLNNMPKELIEQLKTYFETEEGTTLLLRASIAAVSTHKKEKQQAIRDVLLNSINDLNIHYDQKEIFVGIISDLEPYDVIVLKIIRKNGVEIKEINSYEDAYKLCKSKGFQGDRDEFYLICNKLKDKSLIRISELIDGFGDVYSAEILTTSKINDKPKIVSTNLANRLIEYLEDNN